MTTVTSIDGLSEVLAEIASAAVPEPGLTVRVHLVAVSDPSHATPAVSVYGARADQYPEQDCTARTVFHDRGGALIHVWATPGESLSALLARALDFVSIETPVPA